VSDVWVEADAIQMLLEVITANKQARVELAKSLVSELSTDEGTVTPVVIFYARCLSYISSLVNGPVMIKILNNLDSERFNDDAGMRLLFHNILESCA
jgi:hypothetical protein